MRHLFLQRGLALVAALDLARDEPELRRVADVGDDHLARAARDEAAGIDGIDPLGDGRFGREDGGGVLFDGRRFAGEGGFVAHQRHAFKQPAVRGDLVARFEIDDVPHGQLLLGNELHDAAAHHLDLDALFDLVQLVERLGAAALHHDGQNDRYGDGDEDADALRPVEMPALRGADGVDRDRDQPREEEQDEHGLGGSLPDAPQQRLAPRARELVAAVARDVFPHLFVGQAAVRVRLQCGQRLLRRFVKKSHACTPPVSVCRGEKRRMRSAHTAYSTKNRSGKYAAARPDGALP